MGGDRINSDLIGNDLERIYTALPSQYLCETSALTHLNEEQRSLVWGRENDRAKRSQKLS